MEWKDLFIESYGNALRTLQRALEGLTKEALSWQPRPDCNSIGWTTWHLSRALDGMISSIMGEEELWMKDGWYSRFGRPANPADHGVGETPEQVAAFQCPDVRTLLDYHNAVLDRSKAYMATLSASDLDRTVSDGLSHLFPTVGSRLLVTQDELLQHAGQVGYIRGQLEGKGWQPF